ncbi:MAG: hypothetical protein ACE5EA_07625 [Nitrospirota bacterium]
MKKCLSFLIIIGFSILTIGAGWDVVYSEPVKVAENFLHAIINNENIKSNNYIVKRLRNANHWIHATSKDREEIFPEWTVTEFRQQKDDFGFVIIKTLEGQIAIKFEKKDDKWLWASN